MGGIGASAEISHIEWRAKSPGYVIENDKETVKQLNQLGPPAAPKQ
jgi:hypothetical protein